MRARWSLLLSNRAFGLTWTGRTVSWFGNAIAPIALAFAVLDLGGSAATLGLVVGARSITHAVLVLIGGALADRAARNRILVGSAFVAAASQGATAVLVAGESAPVPALMLLGVINGAAAALSGPASAVLIKQLVADDQLRDANAVTQLGMQTALLVGTSAGGLLVATVSPAAGLAIDAATFLVAGLCYLGLPRIIAARAERRSLVADLRDGFSFVVRSPWLRSCTMINFVTMAGFAGGLQVLAPLVADQTFGRAGYGLIGTAQLIGGLTGTAAAVLIKDRVRLPIAISWEAGLAAPLLVLGAGAAGLITGPLLLITAAISMFGAGVLMSLASTFTGLAVQRGVPDDRLGRVSSYLTVAAVGGIPAGELAVGPLAVGLGLAGAYPVLAAVVLGCVVIAVVQAGAGAVSPPRSR
ncbi:MFS transporter [Microlunatus sp. GCM10028923]|uniref:MFS transporter n=1 Tax=Microlunatus sp. GCM10028923 TaxID=3273400 RepID=UPI00360C85B2